MYAPILSEATKTSEWKQVIEVYFRHDLWLNVFFLTLLIIIQSEVVISMNVFDCNDSYHGVTFLVLHTNLYWSHLKDKRVRDEIKKKTKEFVMERVSFYENWKDLR